MKVSNFVRQTIDSFGVNECMDDFGFNDDGEHCKFERQ